MLSLREAFGRSLDLVYGHQIVAILWVIAFSQLWFIANQIAPSMPSDLVAVCSNIVASQGIQLHFLAHLLAQVS